MSGLKFDFSKLISGLNFMQDRFEQSIEMYCETACKKLEAYAKENAPWTDRTAHARRSLRSYYEIRKNLIRLIIAHGVEYGIWLELAHEKKYAILWNTINENSNEIMKGFNKMLERMMK